MNRYFTCPSLKTTYIGRVRLDFWPIRETYRASVLMFTGMLISLRRSWTNLWSPSSFSLSSTPWIMMFESFDCFLCFSACSSIFSLRRRFLMLVRFTWLLLFATSAKLFFGPFVVVLTPFSREFIEFSILAVSFVSRTENCVSIRSVNWAIPEKIRTPYVEEVYFREDDHPGFSPHFLGPPWIFFPHFRTLPGFFLSFIWTTLDFS